MRTGRTGAMLFCSVWRVMTRRQCRLKVNCSLAIAKRMLFADMEEETGIHRDDIVATLMYLHMLKYVKGQHMVYQDKVTFIWSFRKSQNANCTGTTPRLRGAPTQGSAEAAHWRVVQRSCGRATPTMDAKCVEGEIVISTSSVLCHRHFTFFRLSNGIAIHKKKTVQ